MQSSASASRLPNVLATTVNLLLYIDLKLFYPSNRKRETNIEIGTKWDQRCAKPDPMVCRSLRLLMWARKPLSAKSRIGCSDGSLEDKIAEELRQWRPIL